MFRLVSAYFGEYMSRIVNYSRMNRIQWFSVVVVSFQRSNRAIHRRSVSQRPLQVCRRTCCPCTMLLVMPFRRRLGTRSYRDLVGNLDLIEVDGTALTGTWASIEVTEVRITLLASYRPSIV